MMILWFRCLGLGTMMLMIGTGCGTVVVDMSPGTAEIRIVQRRHQRSIVAGQILQLIGTSMALDKRGLLALLLLLLVMMMVMVVLAITVCLACEIL